MQHMISHVHPAVEMKRYECCSQDRYYQYTKIGWWRYSCWVRLHVMISLSLVCARWKVIHASRMSVNAMVDTAVGVNDHY